MIDLARIRNASFTLTPTGYNPEEVDQFLADLADQLAALPEMGGVAAIEPMVFEVEQTAPAGPADPFAAPQEPQHEVEQPQEFEPVAELEHAPEAEPVHQVELPQPVSAERAQADLEGLQGAVERTIAAMDAFVHTELAAVRAASSLEVDDIHRERERMLEEAGEAARAHLDETRVRAEQIVAQARTDGEELRRQVEIELQSERTRFEQALADRDRQAQAQVAAALAAAEDRRREADDLVANASKIQAQVLASIEHARSSLSTATEPAQEPAASEQVAPPAFRDDPWGPPAQQPRTTPLQSLLEARADEPVESDPAAQRADEADATDAAA
jgi:DivIVA domain-containing protein